MKRGHRQVKRQRLITPEMLAALEANDVDVEPLRPYVGASLEGESRFFGKMYCWVQAPGEPIRLIPLRRAATHSKIMRGPLQQVTFDGQDITEHVDV